MERYSEPATIEPPAPFDRLAYLRQRMRSNLDESAGAGRPRLSLRHYHGPTRANLATHAFWAETDARRRRRFAMLARVGVVRALWVADDSVGVDDIAGDCYNLEANPGHHGGARDMAAGMRSLVESVNADGVWGFVCEWRETPDDGWQDADAVWGLLGHDDAGYGSELMDAAVKAWRAARKHARAVRADRRRWACPHCGGTGRRPDAPPPLA